MFLQEAYNNLSIETKVTYLLNAIHNQTLGEEARQMSAVLLRRLFANEFLEFYPKLPAEAQAQLKEQVLVAIQQEQTVQLRHKVCDVAAEVARNLIDDDGNNQWPEFLEVRRVMFTQTVCLFLLGLKIIITRRRNVQQ